MKLLPPSQLSLRLLCRPQIEEVEAADDGFTADDEHLSGGDDDSENDDGKEDRKEPVRQRLEESLADIRNSTMVQTPYRIRRMTAAMAMAKAR